MNRWLLLSLLWVVPCWAAEPGAGLDFLLAPLPAGPAPGTPLAAAAERRPVAEVTPAKPANFLKAEDLITELGKQATQHFPVEGELKFSLARTWPAVPLPEKDWVLQISEWPPEGLTGSMVLRIKVVSGSETVIEGQLPLRVQWWQDVWFATTNLQKGPAIDRGALVARKVDLLREKYPLISATIDPLTLEVRQAVSAGRAITQRDVEKRPLVRKGQMVEVVASSGLLGVRMKAQALESGAEGDAIKLLNLESRKEINGQVQRDAKVQIRF